jgi:hypothetical protein
VTGYRLSPAEAAFPPYGDTAAPPPSAAVAVGTTTVLPGTVLPASEPSSLAIDPVVSPTAPVERAPLPSTRVSDAESEEVSGVLVALAAGAVLACATALGWFHATRRPKPAAAR